MASPRDQTSFGLTKTIMTYKTGELVLYQERPYLVKNLQPKPLKMVLIKLEGGTKKVKPALLTPVPEVAGIIFSSVDDIPDNLISSYCPDMMIVIGSGGVKQWISLKEVDMSLEKVRIRPIGKQSRRLLGEIKSQYQEEVKFPSYYSPASIPSVIKKEWVPLVVCNSKPSSKKGYLKKYKQMLQKAKFCIVVFKTMEETPEGTTADVEMCNGIDWEGCWMFQIQSWDDMPEVFSRIIIGLSKVQSLEKKLEVPSSVTWKKVTTLKSTV